MKKGFTLIELLAVIVILAIIALIATPIVVNIINDSKKESEKRSIEAYIKTVQKTVERYQMTHPTFNPKECEIQKDKLVCEETELKIEMKGETPESGIVIVNNSKINYRSVLLNGKYYNNVSKLISDSDNDGKISIGDEYSYNVNGKDTFNFYVLSIEENQVNLIMDRNICEDGTINYSESNNYCRYAWHSGENDNNYGPDTAMKQLYEATKGWTNVNDMIMNYYDEKNKNETQNGYTSIITNPSTKVTTIIGKQNKTSSDQIFGNEAQPLKARLPKTIEVNGTGCYEYNYDARLGSCPIWMVENLKYENVSGYAGSGNTDKYLVNNNNEPYQNINGYWILSTWNGFSSESYLVISKGAIGVKETKIDNSAGVRPVITVLISNLLN